MIDTVYLHIGTHKTGTTSLQSFLIENEELLLRKHKICYPKFGRNPVGVGAHHYFSMPVNPARPRSYKGWSFQENCELMQREALEREAEHILISSESFCRVEDITALEPIRHIAKRVKVIVYLRRQDDFILSAYAQRIKGGRNIEIHEYENRNLKMLYYNKLCDRWARFFGKENLSVRIYDPKKLYLNSLHNDFLKQLGILTREDFTFPEKRLNISFAEDAIQFKKCFNVIGLAFELNNQLNKMLERYSSKNLTGISSLLSYSERKRILLRFEESNLSLAGKYLGVVDHTTPFSPLTKSAAVVKNNNAEFMNIWKYLGNHNALLSHKLMEVLKQANQSRMADKVTAAENLSSSAMI